MSEQTPKTREDEPETYVQDVQMAEYMANAEKLPRERSLASRKIAKAAFDKYIEGEYQMTKRELERSLGLKPSEDLDSSDTEGADVTVLRGTVEHLTKYEDHDSLDVYKVGIDAKRQAQKSLDFAKSSSDEVKNRYEQADPKSLDSIK